MEVTFERTTKSIKQATDNAALDYDDDDDDGSWADLPLTPEEEAQIAESDEDLKKGEYLTLEELLKGL